MKLASDDARSSQLEGGVEWTYFSNKVNGPCYSKQKNPVASKRGVAPTRSIPESLQSLAYHAVSAQDGYGRLCSYVTAEEQLSAGASLDSSNCAMGVLLAAFNEKQVIGGNYIGGYYMAAASRQLNFVLQSTRRASNGAISQRNAGLQTWSDSFYMASSIAMFGLIYDDQGLLQQAYDQMRLYRSVLLSNNGLMAHIWDYDSNSFQDGNRWATGNGWAAAGMIRVLVSIIQSSYSSSMTTQRQDLFRWTASLLDNAYNFVDPGTGLFHNYIDDSSTFLDGAGSMILAYSTFRLASLVQGADQNIAAAERIYQRVSQRMTRFGHFDNGLQTVNAL